ncbi:MAG: hypothetical protein ACXWQQ_03240 [Pseudobdellovibrio sp.]
MNALISYVSEIRKFTQKDWLHYVAWIGLMFGLFAVTFAFVCIGKSHAAPIPDYAWWVPLGNFIFVMAIAVDSIGHMTRYKAYLAKGESLVHGLTIFAGITSCLLLCLGYSYPSLLKIPILVFIFLSIFYSVVDEFLHWTRYLEGQSDVVEMCSHFFIFAGHFLFIFAWYSWYESGYAGVKETLMFL